MNQHWNDSIKELITPNGDPRMVRICIDILKCEKKVQAAKTAQIFTKWCIEKEIIPTFARLPKRHQGSRSKSVEMKILRNNLREKLEKSNNLKLSLDGHFETLKNLVSAGEFLILCNIINVRKTVFYDYFLGEIEHKKSQLLNKRKTRAPPEKQQKFQNTSNIDIPSEYWDILNPGLNSHIFPKSNTYEIFASFQNLKRNAIKTCKNRQFDMKRRHHVLSQIDHALDQVNHIRPAPTKLPELKQFLIDNNLIVTKSDKTDVAVIMPSNEYYSGIHKTLKDKAYTRLNGSKQNSERVQIELLAAQYGTRQHLIYGLKQWLGILSVTKSL